MPEQEESQTESQPCSEPQDDDNTPIDENGVRQPNPPRVYMLKLVNHIEANRGGKHLKFPIASHPKGPYKHHIVVRVDTDISKQEQFHTYVEFRSEKYLNTFIVTNANDCPSLLNYGATFRMGVLLQNYPQEIVVKGDNVPHFSKMNRGKTGNGTSNNMSNGTCNGISYVNTGNGTLGGTSNMFQILNDIWKR